jgi:hypothetical protein
MNDLVRTDQVNYLLGGWTLLSEVRSLRDDLRFPKNPGPFLVCLGEEWRRALAVPQGTRILDVLAFDIGCDLLAIGGVAGIFFTGRPGSEVYLVDVTTPTVLKERK